MESIFCKRINFSLNEMFSYVEIDVSATMLLTIYFTLGECKFFNVKALIDT